MAPTPTPVPTAPSRPYLTRDPPDIENLARVIVSLTISEISFLPKKKLTSWSITKHLHSQLALNPRTKAFTNAVPTMATKKNKKHWKRNDDKEKNLNNCG